jgi:hypothetical protein
VRHLETAWETSQPYDIGLVHLHAASSLAAHRMGITLRRAEYRTERPVDLELWTR